MQLFGKSCRNVAPRSLASEMKRSRLAHRSGRQIVQHDDGVGLSEAHVERTLDPGLRAGPVLWNDVPQHAGVGVVAQVFESFTVKQSPVQQPAAAEWTKEASRMGKIADQRLGAAGSRQPRCRAQRSCRAARCDCRYDCRSNDLRRVRVPRRCGDRASSLPGQRTSIEFDGAAASRGCAG